MDSHLDRVPCDRHDPDRRTFTSTSILALLSGDGTPEQLPGALAGYVPARRVARIDPAIVLRAE